MKPKSQNKSDEINTNKKEEHDQSGGNSTQEIENPNSQNESNKTELSAMENETEKKLERDENDINGNADSEIIRAQLIRTEGPLAELPAGTFFFTLYADDFIESSMKILQKLSDEQKLEEKNTKKQEVGYNNKLEAKTKEKQEKIYRIVNERFHMLTVSFFYF